MTIPLVAPVINNNSRRLRGIINNVGLSAQPAFVLDAGDLASYDGSSQTWTDATGNGNNYFRGADGTAEATDPTFNGSAGDISDATYFSLDGGDFFRPTAVHTFSDNWHKDSGAVTFIIVGQFQAGAASQLIFTTMNGTNDGVELIMLSTEIMRFQHALTNTTNETISATAVVPTGSGIHMLSVRYSEASLSVEFGIDLTFESFAAGASTNTDAPGGTCNFFNAAAPMIAGTRVHGMAAWSADIGQAGVSNIYKHLRTRRYTALA